MKLAILSRKVEGYSTRRLREAAKDRGHKVKVLNTLKFAINLERGLPSLYFRQKELSLYDAVRVEFEMWGVSDDDARYLVKTWKQR